jgi:gas vesicle protein
MSKSSVSAILGFVAGAAAGAALGVLFAPDKGTSTRKKIKNQAQKVGDDFKENLAGKIDDLNQFVSSFVKETKEKMDDLEKKAKQEVQGVKEKVTKK